MEYKMQLELRPNKIQIKLMALISYTMMQKMDFLSVVTDEANPYIDGYGLQTYTQELQENMIFGLVAIYGCSI